MGAKTEKLWFTRVEAAELSGVGERQFDAVIRPRMADEGIRGKGKTLRFQGAAVVAAVVDYRIEQAKPIPEDGDPLMLSAGGNSPNLERYRLVKAQLAERDLAERDRKLVRFDLIKSALRFAFGALRATGDRLVRQFGNEAGDIYNEGVGEFEAAASRVIEQLDDRQRDNATPGLRDDDAVAAAANAQRVCRS